jgi:chromosome segregation ATPase
MPNPSELARQAQENREDMAHISGTLNRDVFAGDVLRREINEQKRIAAEADDAVTVLRDHIDRAQSTASTARDRVASLEATLATLEEKTNG